MVWATVPPRMVESAPDPRPLLVVTVLLDQAARPALVTQSHGDAMERAIGAAASHEIAGLELAELPIATLAFAALRRSLTMPPSTVALYDIFPLASGLPAAVRTVAGQFLAAEALWTLEEQGMLSGGRGRREVPAAGRLEQRPERHSPEACRCRCERAYPFRGRDVPENQDGVGCSPRGVRRVGQFKE